MVRIGTLVLSARDLRRAAGFWADALGYVQHPATVGTDDSPVLIDPDGAGPALALDETDRPHLDLAVDTDDEFEAEVARLLALGATLVPWTYPEGVNHVVLADPEGNLFCVVNRAGPVTLPGVDSRD